MAASERFRKLMADAHRQDAYEKQEAAENWVPPAELGEITVCLKNAVCDVMEARDDKPDLPYVQVTYEIVDDVTDPQNPAVSFKGRTCKSRRMGFSTNPTDKSAWKAWSKIVCGREVPLPEVEEVLVGLVEAKPLLTIKTNTFRGRSGEQVSVIDLVRVL